MFAATHMAIGALMDSQVPKRAPAALIALATHPPLDMTIFWHAREAKYQWPNGSFPLLEVVPYPRMESWLIVAILVVSAIVLALLLRKYWWGMLWALVPDIVDWVILRPLTGEYPIHKLFMKVSTPWGFGVEMLLVAVVVLVIYLSRKRKRAIT